MKQHLSVEEAWGVVRSNFFHDGVSWGREEEFCFDHSPIKSMSFDHPLVPLSGFHPRTV